MNKPANCKDCFAAQPTVDSLKRVSHIPGEEDVDFVFPADFECAFGHEWFPGCAVMCCDYKCYHVVEVGLGADEVA